VKQRFVTFALAAGALFLFYLLFIPKPVPQIEKPSEPLSVDTGADGLQGLWRWLQAQNIPVVSLRSRYDRLGGVGNGDHGGNVMITVLPHRYPLRRSEWRPLTNWIESGNTLLVIAALDDTPRWALFLDPASVQEISQLTHIQFTSQQADSRAHRLRKGLNTLLGNPNIQGIPVGEHPLLSNVQQIHGASEYPASSWDSLPIEDHMPMELLQRSDTKTPMMWLGRQGEGQVIVSALASPFTNSQIDKADNARLLSNIIAWSRAPHGVVIFDDAHQGLVSYYDPKAFFSDPRLHRTLLWLIALWLVFVLGPLPLRGSFSPWKPVDETVLIEASGRFYSSVVTPAEAAHRLIENFFNRLRRKLGLPENGVPLWDWLGAQASVSNEERASLQRRFASVYAGERVELTELQRLLSDIQRKII